MHYILYHYVRSTFVILLLLSNDKEFDTLLRNGNVRSLINKEGYQVVRFESLVDGGKYTLGPLQQKQGPDEKKRHLGDLLFYHHAAIETTTSKSSKLLRVKKMDDGSKCCFLCGTSGTPTNKIEASHVLRKQDISATRGEEALLALDTLKTWSAGYGWKRPFRIHDPVNLIWLCHTHNLEFDQHKFGLSLGGLDNSVVFFSCLDEYTKPVIDANARLADSMQPYYAMSYVSRRVIGMRLCSAQKAGYFIDHNNPDGWEAVTALSAAASLKTENNSDEKEDFG